MEENRAMQKQSNNRINVIIIFILLAVVFVLTVCITQPKQTPDEDQQFNIIAFYKEIDSVLQKENIVEYGKWYVENGKDNFLFYIIKRVKADSKEAHKEESFVIFDQSGKQIYEEGADYFSGIEVIDMLRQSRRQLVIKSISHGGSGRFFKILDYQDGKITSLTDEDNTLYSGEVEIIPQYQEIKYYSLPYQVLLGEYVSSPSAETKVLRYTNGKYVLVGSFSQTEVGRIVEKKIN